MGESQFSLQTKKAPSTFRMKEKEYYDELLGRQRGVNGGKDTELQKFSSRIQMVTKVR